MLISEILDKLNNGIDKNGLDPCERLVIDVYEEQKKQLGGIPAVIINMLSKDGADAVEREYGWAIRQAAAGKSQTISCGEFPEKHENLKKCTQKAVSLVGTLIQSYEIREFKKGIFSKKSYECELTFCWVRFKYFENIMKQMAEAFMRQQNPNYVKALEYLNICDQNDPDILKDLSENPLVKETERAAYKNKAREIFKNRASMGEAYSMGVYAQMIWNENPQAAFRFAQAAAEKDNPAALFILGKAFENGTGTDGEKNPQKAKEYFERASQRGNADAQYHLAAIYKEDGEPEKAFEYFEKAAEHGNPDAMYEAGIALRDGIGTEKNTIRAYRLFSSAAAFGNVESLYLMGMNMLEGISCEKNVEGSFDFFDKAAKAGHARAQLEAGKLYLEGIGTARNRSKAFELFISAADAGIPEAQYHAGMAYESGRDVAKDIEKAVEFYKKAADKGNEPAARRLAELFNDHSMETGLREDAFKYMKKLAEEGNTSASMMVARAYLNGDCVQKNEGEAFRYLQMAAYGGSKEGQYMVGVFYRDGIGIRKNITKASEYFNLAASKGHGKSIGDAAWADKKLKELKNIRSFESRVQLLYEQEDFDSIFEMVREYGAITADDELMLNVLSGYVEKIVAESAQKRLAKVEDLKDELVMIADKTKDLQFEELFYDAAIKFEQEDKWPHSLLAFIFAALGGCQKGWYTLSNMAVEGSRYFLEIRDE